MPQRSPFRYPGGKTWLGKTWLVPRLRLWLSSLSGRKRDELIEPFTGGGIVSLTAAFEGLTRRVTMVELDSDVAAVWQTILGGDAEWLAERIVSFSLTPERVQDELERDPQGTPERAFKTLLRNRINHGGILAPGSGRLYTHNALDHEELFRTTQAVAGEFLMTYDNAAGVQFLAQQYGFASLAIPMKNTHHAAMTELLISRDLGWA